MPATRIDIEPGLRPSQKNLIITTENPMIAIGRATRMPKTRGGKSAGLDNDGLYNVPVTEAILPGGTFATNGGRFNGIPFAERRLRKTAPYVVTALDASLPLPYGRYGTEHFTGEGLAIAQPHQESAVSHDGVEFTRGPLLFKPTDTGEPSVLDRIAAARRGSHEPPTTDRHRGTTQRKDGTVAGAVKSLSDRAPKNLHSIHEDLPPSPNIVAAAQVLQRGAQAAPSYAVVFGAELTRIADANPGIADHSLRADRLGDRLDPSTVLLASAKDAADTVITDRTNNEYQTQITLTFLVNDLQAQPEFRGLPPSALYEKAQQIMSIEASSDGSTKNSAHYSELVTQARKAGEARTINPTRIPFSAPAAVETATGAPMSDLTPQGDKKRKLVHEHFLDDGIEIAKVLGLKLNIKELMAARSAELDRIQREHGVSAQLTAKKPHTIVTKADLKHGIAEVVEKSKRAAGRLVEATAGIMI